MPWNTLPANYWVSYTDMNDAIFNKYFKLKPGASLPVSNGWMRRQDVTVNLFADIDDGAWAGLNGVLNWPQKNWLIPQFLPVCPVVNSSVDVPTQIMSYNFTLDPYVYNAAIINKIRVKVVDNEGTVYGTKDFNKPFTGTFSGTVSEVPPVYYFSVQYLDVTGTVIADPCIVPIITQTITGLATPTNLIYNSNDGLMYYTEMDTMLNIPSIIEGAMGWFDPLTAQTYNDMDYAPSSIGRGCNTCVYVPANNTIYAQGYHSRGTVIFNCTTKNTTFINFDTNNSSSFGNMYLVGTKVYGAYVPIAGFVVIDTVTNTRITDFIPPLKAGHSDFFLLQIGTQAWIFYFNSTNALDKPKCEIYDLATLSNSSTPIATINNLANTQFINGRYAITEPVFDFTNNKLWYTSLGDSRLYSITVATRTITDSLAMPIGAKNYCTARCLRHEQSQTVYVSGAQVSTLSESGDPITFKLNPTIPSIQTVSSTNFAKFVYAPNTGKTYSAVPGRAVYNSPNTGYDSDGSIQIYN